MNIFSKGFWSDFSIVNFVDFMVVVTCAILPEPYDWFAILIVGMYMFPPVRSSEGYDYTNSILPDEYIRQPEL